MGKKVFRGEKGVEVINSKKTKWKRVEEGRESSPAELYLGWDPPENILARASPTDPWNLGLNLGNRTTSMTLNWWDSLLDLIEKD
jgi:hypothetical protein